MKAGPVTPSSIAISANGLSKRFGSIKAVNSLDLKIARGEIFGLLGPNAAGKSTTIRMLAGVIRPDAGDASVLGLNLLRQAEAIKHRIGYVAQSFGLYPELTVRENVEFYSRLYGSDINSRILLEKYEINEFANRRAGYLSGGYKRRLSIACAVSHDPEILFLDEPTAGIDPVTRKELWDIFYDLAAAGKSLFVSTHYMEEAERCGKLTFLAHGRCVAAGSPDQIRSQMGEYLVWSAKIGHDPSLSEELESLPGVVSLNRFGTALRIITFKDVPQRPIEQLIKRFSGQRVSLETAEPNLEDVFITLTRDGDPS